MAYNAILLCIEAFFIKALQTLEMLLHLEFYHLHYEIPQLSPLYAFINTIISVITVAEFHSEEDKI